jgi:hypothetical protein
MSRLRLKDEPGSGGVQTFLKLALGAYQKMRG